MPNQEIIRNRANIYVKNGDTGVYLYTNSLGHKLPKILQKALLRGKSKWGNTNVLTRVIFSEMIQNDVLGNDGFSISTQISDNDHLILAVNDQKEIVGICGESGRCYKRWNFEKYLNIEESRMTWEVISGNSRFEDDSNNTHYGAPIFDF
jgi:hypothetical protein